MPRLKAPLASPPHWAELPQGSLVVVDTAPFIYFLEGHPVFAPRFAALFEAEAARRIDIAVSVITLAEVLAGPLRAGQEALARRYERQLSVFTLVPVSASIAAQAARLRVRYGLKLPDAIQLATALEVGATAFVTHDRDFSGIDGVVILTGDQA